MKKYLFQYIKFNVKTNTLGYFLITANLAQAQEAISKDYNVLYISADDLNNWIGPMGRNKQI